MAARELWVDLDGDCPECREITAWRDAHPDVHIDRPWQVVITPTTSRERHRDHRRVS